MGRTEGKVGGAFLPDVDYDITGAWTFKGTLPALTNNGDVVGTTGAQSLASKTLTSPTVSGTVAGGASYTAPTLTAPTITGVLQENAAAAAVGAATQVFSSHALADNTAVDFFTVTVPNSIAGGMISLMVGSTLGDGDSTDSAEYNIGISRIAGAATKATVGAKLGAGATTGAGANAVITASVSSMTGATSTTQTFTVQIKNARSAGAATNHPTTAVAVLVNLVAAGITIAAA